MDQASDYRPCYSGIHICGIDEAREEFITVQNFPFTAVEARQRFDAIKAEFAETGDGDFVVDLMQKGDICEDFYVRRQMLDRMRQALL